MVKFLSSPRITTVCLFLLFVLTFWGTIAQVQQGLYAAQDRFFNSFFFLAAGFIPFPGAQSVLWALFVNLTCMVIAEFKKYAQWSNLGLLIIHAGLLLYLFAAFMVFHVSQESYLRLAEGESTDVSNSYYDWELAFWKDSGAEGQGQTFDTKDFKQGFRIPFENKDFTVTVKKFFANSGLAGDILTAKPLMKDREDNIAGGVFALSFAGRSYPLILYGGETQATSVAIAGKTYHFILRHTQYPLPFTIRLDHFKAEFHPGTNIPKSFESTVTVLTGPLERQARIFMNSPLRYKEYTVYQASYDTDHRGRQYSTLAVVKNSVRVLPYIGGLVVFVGLALHFLMRAFMAKFKI